MSKLCQACPLGKCLPKSYNPCWTIFTGKNIGVWTDWPSCTRWVKHKCPRMNSWNQLKKNPGEFLKPAKTRRQIKEKQCSDYISNNILERHIINNGRGFTVQNCNEPLKNSFFVKTEWSTGTIWIQRQYTQRQWRALNELSQHITKSALSLPVYYAKQDLHCNKAEAENIKIVLVN